MHGQTHVYSQMCLIYAQIQTYTSVAKARGPTLLEILHTLQMKSSTEIAKLYRNLKSDLGPHFVVFYFRIL